MPPSHHGQKVTTDPETLNNPKNENPGMVTSDSLAAESIQDGGSFAANSDNRGPMEQPSYSVNTNNTDTSNAVRLDPATDAAAREAEESWGDQSQLNAGSKLNADSSGSGSYGDAASTSFEGGYQQPKGKNLQEGGFDSDAPNASYTTNIGGKNDPGRVALNQMQEADTPYAGGAGPRDEKISNDGQYDSLKDTSA